MSDEGQAAPVADDAPAEQPAGSDDASARRGVADRASAPDDGLTPRQRRLHRLQRKRERRIWFGLIVAAFVVLALFMVAFWPVMAGRLDAVNQVDQALALLNRAKPAVAAVDKIVTVQLSSAAAPGVPATAPQILVARRDLKQALTLVSGAMPHLTEDEQTRARAIQAATQARLDMVGNAPAILVASIKAVNAKAFVDRAWQASQSASSAEGVAVSEYRTANASAVESASVSLQRVRGQLGDARALYVQAGAAFPGAGFERYVAYIDLRIQGVKQLQSAANNWLKGNAGSAAAQFAAHQLTLGNAVAAASKLPSPPAAPGVAFRKLAGSASDAYKKAKAQALEADKALGGS